MTGSRQSRGVAPSTGLLAGAIEVPSLSEPGRSKSGYAVCRVCHGAARRGLATCWSCRRVASQLRTDPVTVVPLFLFSPGSAAHRTLVCYKAAASPSARTARARALEEVLASFLEGHLGCVLDRRRRAALIVPVPSTIGVRRSWDGRHPVGALADAALVALGVAEGGRVNLRVAEVLRTGPVPPRRLEARAGGFEVRPDAVERVAGAPVLVLDDVFTSGARALSAAVALSRAAVVPLGRLVRPDHNPAAAAFWADRTSLSWDPSTCAACRPRSQVTPAEACRAAVTTYRLTA